MANRTPWKLRAWTDESKSTAVTTAPITAISDVNITEACMTPYQATVICALTDKKAGQMSRAYYVELTRGWTTDVLVYKGYINTLTKQTGKQATYQLDLVDALFWLSKQMLGGNLVMNPPKYTSILDVFNGISLNPGELGILNEFNWHAEWVDGINGSDGTHVGQVGGHYVDKYKGEWDNPLNSSVNVCEDLSIYLRPKKSATNNRAGGTIQIGPLGDTCLNADSTPYTVWGGDKLLVEMKRVFLQPASDKEPNIAYAHDAGYSVILSASRQDNYTGIWTLAMPLGHGKPENNGVTLDHVDGSVPIDHTGAVINGWSIVPSPPAIAGGRIYYQKDLSKVSANGHQYKLICWAEQDTKQGIDQGYTWVKAVYDDVSALKWGITQHFMHSSKIEDAQTLLSGALGFLDLNADPIPSWQVTVAPAMDDNGMTTMPEPGQLVTVQYRGETISVDLEGNVLGDYIYAKMPIIGDPTDENGISYTNELCHRMARVVQVVHSWTGNLYTQTLTLGLGKWHSKFFDTQLAKRMLLNEKRHPHKHSFKKATIDHLPVLLSVYPNPATEDIANRQIEMTSGSEVVIPVRHPQFFSDHHGFEFTVVITSNPAGNGQYLDMWIDRPVSLADPMDPNANGQRYLILRVSLSNSNTHCGFFTTSNGSTFQQRGMWHPSSALDANGNLVQPGMVRISVYRGGGRYVAHITYLDTIANDVTNAQNILATWHDTAAAGSQIMSGTGAIGWKLHQGATGENAFLFDLHAISQHLHNHGRAGQHPHHPHLHNWHNMHSEVVSWDGTTASVTMRVKAATGKLFDSAGNIMVHEGDATPISFSADVTGISLTPGQHLVYNAADFTISDGTNSVAPKNFGAQNYVNTPKSSHDMVIDLGRLTEAVDPHTGKPWIDGQRAQEHQAHGSQHANSSVGRRKQHPHNPGRNHFHNLYFYFTNTTTAGGLTAPVAPTAGAPTGSGSFFSGGVAYTWAVINVVSGVYSPISADSASQTPAVGQNVPLTGIAVGPPGTSARLVYRKAAGGSYGLVQTISNNTSTTWTDNGSPAGAGPSTTAGAYVGAFNWTEHDPTQIAELRSDDGAILHTFPIGAGSNVPNVGSGDMVVYNRSAAAINVSDGTTTWTIDPTSFGNCGPSANLATDAAIELYKVGRVSAHPDKNDEQLYMTGWNTGSIVMGGVHHQLKSIDASKLTGRNSEGGTVMPAAGYIAATSDATGTVQFQTAAALGLGGPVSELQNGTAFFDLQDDGAIIIGAGGASAASVGAHSLSNVTGITYDSEITPTAGRVTFTVGNPFVPGAQVDVGFDRAIAQPVIFASAQDGNTIIGWQAINITTTGFSLYPTGGTPGDGATFTVGWWGFGQA